MKLRHLRETDIERLLSLWNRNLTYDRIGPELLEEKVWDDPQFDASLTCAVEHEKQLVGFLMAVVRSGAEGSPGYVKSIVVDGPLQRRGMGSRLLKEIEKLLKARGVSKVRLFESAPNYLTPGLDVRYTHAMVFFERHGYKRIGETFNLDADLTQDGFSEEGDAARLASRGIQTRRAAAADAEKLTAFLQANWPAWIEEVSRGLRNAPVSIHLATADDEIVGFSAYDCNNANTGWFGPMGTAEGHRGAGIGGVLLRRCLADLKAQGHRYATIPWVGPIPFYVHYCGAQVSRVFFRYEKTI